MAHATRINETQFIYSGDYSGLVVVTREGLRLEVPFEDLKAFVAQYVTKQHIGRLEQADPDEALGLK